MVSQARVPYFVEQARKHRTAVLENGIEYRLNSSGIIDTLKAVSRIQLEELEVSP